MACPPTTYQNTGQCIDAEIVSVEAKVWYANHNEWEAARLAAVPTIEYTDNEITAFEPTSLLYPLNMGVKFDSAPTDTSAVTTSGLKKHINSVILQVLDNSAAADKQKALFNVGKFVVIVELRGATIAPEDAFKVYGAKRGLTLADGAGTENANADGGQYLLTLASDTEDGDYEDWPRMTLADGIDYTARLAAITAALVPAV